MKRNGLFRFDTYIMRDVLGNVTYLYSGKICYAVDDDDFVSLLFCSDASFLTFKLREISVGFPLSRGRVTKNGGGGNARFAHFKNTL